MSPSSVSTPYVHRHIGPNQNEREAMCTSIGYPNIAALVDAAVPDAIRAKDLPTIAPALSEEQAHAQLRHYADKNIVLKAFYGQGFYDTITPPVIRRNVVEDPGWYTAYTPYQPEISQGRLEALLNFQTMVSEITGLPIANASLLDEASAVAEAIGLMSRTNKKGRRVILDTRLHPQVLNVASERARAIDVEVEIADISSGLVGEDLIGVVLAYPGTEGDVIDLQGVINDIHARGGLATIATDLLALQLLKSPGELGADIAVGSSQRFGVPLFFGGPHAAFMSVTEALKRQLPGRIVGVSKDAAGNPAYRLALQTREQHIRREKATSNICTAQALLAVCASMYAIWHGPAGLRAIAERIHHHAISFAEGIQSAGGTIAHQVFFDTVTVVVPSQAEEIVDKLAKTGYLVRAIGTDKVSVSFGESTTEEDVATLAQAFDAQPAHIKEVLFDELLRTTAALHHPIFSSVHSETQMLRYLRLLKDKDLALDRSMIPLGSCTMKLNPTAGMEPITWPEFANIHPYAPDSHTVGWRELIKELEGWLVDITGYAQVSLQPNAGSQGELAGLLAIRRYHLSRGDNQRDIVLIPQSAHGTNAASATLAKLRVVVVATASDGSIDLDDLDAKLEKYAAHVAGIMITYPSTHGVYEDTVRTVCDKVHAVGGQVYIDGANLNALAGIARPGHFGGDVSHLNLHKTFAIPHGGGGPGVGPVAVAQHLVPFLPADPVASDATNPLPTSTGVPISSARFGSAGVLPITWAYIAMMGGAGLAEATAQAILNANYLAKNLTDYFPVLYTGANGLVAHECILDLREITATTGVTAADVAKRLIDYGFHAPTLSFPVSGTLMVEPTESEDRAELDRFITAMRSIRAEIDDIATGVVSYEESVLHHAPFTAETIASDQWDYSFTRTQAVYPVSSLRRTKYFPPVRRLDEAYGDRNFACSCPPPEVFDIED
ncbi:glycine dehydrogenase, decarboxylating [Corynebacterium kutscheri]|uniref:Glycine dehydrogenase (decarboxylating) n=1 Tax=Corynebacterium kutscheri TaxID=35755 RepID=A0A0F6TDH3_9CORY|nr:aminomethyl-transferring glycine dehydrogenase [Corynebacterium kutscheri]AKE41606.1 glycine dehydrogenase, decarboxylating [Corynebacterium kutscheri]VEH09932.1 Glycine cleavage system P protein [Corynebacterium kutscheri]